ncbi:MAG: hypothetical protein C4308_02975 [Chitinophagaceae bacterium]
MQISEPTNENFIVSWAYSREEWKTFSRWQAKQNGFFHYILIVLFAKKQFASGVQLTSNSVHLGRQAVVFSNEENELRRIDIHDKGKFNLMNIAFRNKASHQITEIKFPIPKGRLKEAIVLRERLLGR